jgi:hypothetical protein
MGAGQSAAASVQGLTRNEQRAKFEEGDPVGSATTSDLFAILWDARADLLGTAGTARLLKRAAGLQRPGARNWPN